MLTATDTPQVTTTVSQRAERAPVVTASGRHAGRLLAVLALVVLYLVVEAAAGWWTGSLALLADAGHMLADAAGIGLSLLAVWLSGRPAAARRTFGHYRAEILAALLNALLMLVVAGSILWEAYQRWLDPQAVAAVPVMIVAAGGLAVNAISAVLLHRAAGESLNSRGAFLEVLSDLLASLGVLLAGAVTWLTAWPYADTLVSAAIALFIVPRAWSLLRQALDVLLEATPAHVELEAVEAALLSVPGVQAVHDLHVWTITSGMESVTAHLVLEEGTDAAQSQVILRQARRLLEQRFGLDHATLQLETYDLRASEVPH
ncbi:MAG TPA: cation diffusion facilitator family transporter [Chloroflexota bacterium]|jgi:cobalt-zinc-cadmium efflux system protein|nr:cation diffusion facilitator family transporter [Chloroflexota bacterium]